jgi:hypothetical protein
VLMTLAALESALHTVGYSDFTPGAGTRAAEEVLAHGF